MRKVNLISQEIIQEVNKPKVNFSIVVSVICAIIIILFEYFLFSGRVSLQNKNLAEYLEKEKKYTFKELEGELAEMDNKITSLRNSNSQQALFIDEDYFSINLLNLLSNVTDSKIWFKNISLDKKIGGCKIKGFSYQAEAVSNFITNLDKLSYFKDAELGNLQKEMQNNENVLSFEVNCKLVKSYEENIPR